MSEGFCVDRVWMLHSGGTKFYQIFEFHPERSTGKKVTVTHWGKLDGLTREFARPVNGGQTQVKDGALAYSTKSGKSKRGYSTANSDSLTIKPDGFWLTQTFGATLAHDIHLAMFGSALQPKEEGVPPSDALDTSIVPKKPEPVPEAWGSW